MTAAQPDTHREAMSVRAPIGGTAVGLAGVPDEVFAEAMVGPGTAIDPRRTDLTACSPIDGTLVKLHPHAFVVVDSDERGVLVHLGIDTVQLQGAGFTLLAAEQDTVHAGQPLVRWDPAAIEAGGRSPVCPVVALDADAGQLAAVLDDGEVQPGDPLFTWA